MEKPILAICYDFDKTLTPNDMQAQGYIQSVGYDVKEFWEKSNGLAKANGMDCNLAYMLMMKEEAEGRVLFTREKLMDYGAKISLFPGVEKWFSRTRGLGEKYGVEVEHYIISSGLKEMIEGTRIAKDGVFKAIYASSFYYNDKGVATWPAQVVNYTNKTQFLFRISKGCLDVNDDNVNKYMSPKEVRIPFRNIVYIGDSDTDVPCMKLVNANGGYSIGVFNPETRDKSKVYQMMHDNRINFFVPADYSKGAELDKLLEAIVKKTSSYEVLDSISIRQREEVEKQEQKNKIKTCFLELDRQRQSAGISWNEVMSNFLNSIND